MSFYLKIRNWIQNRELFNQTILTELDSGKFQSNNRSIILKVK